MIRKGNRWYDSNGNSWSCLLDTEESAAKLELATLMNLLAREIKSAKRRQNVGMRVVPKGFFHNARYGIKRNHYFSSREESEAELAKAIERLKGVQP